VGDGGVNKCLSHPYTIISGIAHTKISQINRIPLMVEGGMDVGLAVG